jgi:uncharacterized SAM-binding protein YcdF (DUF218 family)
MSSTIKSSVWFRIVLAVFALALVWVGAIYWLVSQQAEKDESQKADAIVVFGAAEYAGHPSPVYRARLDHAYTLFREGMAPLIITTGGGAQDPRFTEGGVGRDYLVAHGVPDRNIIAETQSNDTSESAVRVANIFRANGIHTCLAVSDGYHMFRVKQMLGREGVTVYASPRPDSRLPSRWERIRLKLREVMSYTAWKARLPV